MNNQDIQNLKDFVVFLIKSPALWIAFVALINSNQKWLFPNIPDEVMASFNNFITVFSGLVVAYLSGQYMEKQKQKRQLAKLLIQQTPAENKKEEIKKEEIK